MSANDKDEFILREINWIGQVLKTDVVLSEVFRAMQDRDASIGILDYGVRQTSLEEVFLKIARESEAAFQNKNNK